MSAIQKLLTDHIDVWTAADAEKKSGRGRASGNADSVYGIKKLRELLLELAVRGKLVAQVAKDEPARELCKRIQAEKSRLVKSGTIRKQKPQPPISGIEKPFEVPASWEWQRLDDISPMSLIDGDWIESKDQDPEGEIRLVQLADIGVGSFKDKSDRFINKEAFERLRCTQLQKGDVLIARLPSPIGRACLFPGLDQMAITVVDVAILRPLEMFYDQYVVAAINSKTFRDQVESFGKGATRFRVATGNLKSLLIPIPPLAEQHRIVAKVDELMALCDQLETQHVNAAEAHEKLVSYLLSTLTQSQSAADFSENWQRIAAYFDTLFTTEASIDALKQTLLQLAVMGKLAPHDPDEESAIELLKRIATEKDKLVQEGKLKKDKSVTTIASEEIPFELPRNWEWTSLSEITTGMDSGWSPACLPSESPSDDVWGVLKTTAVQVMSYLEYENKELPEKLVPRPEAEVKVGDVLFTRAGPTNRVAISCLVQKTRPRLMISDKIIRFHPILVDGRYLTLCLNTGVTADYLERAKSGMAASQVNISQSKLRLAPIPIPPINLQHRIVAKVEEIGELCDRLKLSLISAKGLQQRLADVVIEQTGS